MTDKKGLPRDLCAADLLQSTRFNCGSSQSDSSLSEKNSRDPASIVADNESKRI